MESSRLPLLEVVTEGGQPILDEPKRPARLTVFRRVLWLSGFRWISLPSYWPWGGGKQVFSIGIELRGKLAQSFPKKSYGFEVWDTSGQDLDASLLGMPPESDWVLHGPYTDKTLIRNVLAYQLSNSMGRYAPRTRLVELVVHDGSTEEPYRGVYVLAEKIKRGPDRVAIAKLEPLQAQEPEISGGYIVRLDKLDGDTFFTTARGTRVLHVYPRDLGSGAGWNAQRQWLQGFFEQFEDAVSDMSTNEYAKVIDTWSFIDYLILNEALKNVDALRISTYLHKDRAGPLRMGPVWDFDLSMGNAHGLSQYTEHWLVGSIDASDPYQQPFWWSKLLANPDITVPLIVRWFKFRLGPLSTPSILSAIDALVGRLAGASRRNFERWPILAEPIWPSQTAAGSYEAEIAVVKNWQAIRLQWIDDHVLDLYRRGGWW